MRKPTLHYVASILSAWRKSEDVQARLRFWGIHLSESSVTRRIRELREYGTIEKRITRGRFEYRFKA